MDHSTDRHDELTEPVPDPFRSGFKPRAVVVRVVAGPEAGTERTIAEGERVLVGSSATCALRLSDRRVSRRHLAIEQTNDGLLLRDLGSTNGTAIRGVSVREAILKPGDVIEIGDSQISIADVDRTAQAAPPEAESFGRMIGKSVASRRMFALAPRIARAEMSVLIEGETGTGKTALAEELHAASARAQHPLIVFDPAADDPQAGAMSLFGVAPAVVPGSPDGREGLLEQAQHGTLLIHEPGDLAPDLQRRLASALSRKEAQRVGANNRYPFDVRILSTSSRNLDRLVERGLFREDLFHLLVATRLEIPPLKDRPEDVTALAKHFWAAAKPPAEMAPAFLAHLESHSWPGNVRELENTVARHLATGELEIGSRSRAPGGAASAGGDVVGEVLAKRLPLVQARQEVVVRFERLYLEQVLREHNGNVTRAARASGVAHRYFQALKARRQK